MEGGLYPNQRTGSQDTQQVSFSLPIHSSNSTCWLNLQCQRQEKALIRTFHSNEKREVDSTHMVSSWCLDTLQASPMINFGYLTSTENHSVELCYVQLNFSFHCSWFILQFQHQSHSIMRHCLYICLSNRW